MQRMSRFITCRYLCTGNIPASQKVHEEHKAPALSIVALPLSFLHHDRPLFCPDKAAVSFNMFFSGRYRRQIMAILFTIIASKVKTTQRLLGGPTVAVVCPLW